MPNIRVILLAAALAMASSSCALPGKSGPEAEDPGVRTGIGAQAEQSGGNTQAGQTGGGALTGETAGHAQTGRSGEFGRPPGGLAGEANGYRTDPAGNGEEALPAGGERMMRIADIPDRDIALYGASDGVVLKIGGHEGVFGWTYMTPREIPPSLYAADFDADGEEELAAILHIGSGTGVSIEELHIVEFNAEGRMEDHVFAERDYIAQLDGRLAFRPPGRDGSATGEIEADSRTWHVNLDTFTAGEYGQIADRLVYGSIVRFRAEQGMLHAEFAVGIAVEPFVTPEYIGALRAGVEYRNGSFRLTDLTFEPEPEYRIS